MFEEIDGFPISDIYGTDNNVYPVVYAILINTYNDFVFTTVKEAYLVGVSVIDDVMTQEVVFIDEEIDLRKGEEFPRNSMPSSMTFLKYEDAKDFTRSANKELLKEYKKTHFDYEVEKAKEAIKLAYEDEDKTVDKNINRDVENPHLFSTTYIKTKYPS